MNTITSGRGHSISERGVASRRLAALLGTAGLTLGLGATLAALPAAAAPAPVQIDLGDTHGRVHDHVRVEGGGCITYAPATTELANSSAWVAVGEEALTAHGQLTGNTCPSVLDLAGQSAVGITPLVSGAITSGETIKIAEVTHYNNPVLVDVGHFTGNLSLNFAQFPDAELTFPWTLWETPNHPAGGAQCEYGEQPCADKITFTQTVSDVELVRDGIPYSLTLTGFGSCEDGAGSEVNPVFWTPENATTSTCIYGYFDVAYDNVQVSKTVTGATEGYTGGEEAVFEVSYSCQNPAVAEDILEGSVMLAAGATATLFEGEGVPVGWTCTVEETAPSGHLADASYSWGAPIVSPSTFVVGERDDLQVLVDNSIHRSLEMVEITKTVTEAEEISDGSWKILYRIDVTNPLEQSSAYTLTDTLDFGEGLSPEAATWRELGAAEWTEWASIPGPEVLAADRDIAAGATHSYEVSVTATVADGVIGTDAGTCAAEGEEPSGGFLNRATVVVGDEEAEVTACTEPVAPEEPTTPPTTDPTTPATTTPATEPTTPASEPTAPAATTPASTTPSRAQQLPSTGAGAVQPMLGLAGLLGVAGIGALAMRSRRTAR